MASDKLEIDEKALLSQVTSMKDAIEDYKAIGEKPFDDDIDALDEMNTDFTAKLKVMLKNLNSSNKKIVKALDKIAANTEKIASNLKEVDEHAVQSMGYEGE